MAIEVQSKLPKQSLCIIRHMVVGVACILHRDIRRREMLTGNHCWCVRTRRLARGEGFHGTFQTSNIAGWVQVDI